MSTNLILREYERFWNIDGSPKPGTERASETGWKHNGKTIMAYDTGRSIWFDGMHGAGGGEVRMVTHLYLEDESAPVEMPYGAPIYESELIQVTTQ